MTIELGMLLVFGVGGAAMFSRVFIGCEAEQTFAHGIVELALSFDPKGSVGAVPIQVRRVDFAVRRDGLRGSTRSVHSLVAGGVSVIDRTGARVVHDEAPDFGQYLLSFYLLEDIEVSEQWTVRCDGYRDPADLSPAYPSRGEVAQTVTLRRIGRKFRFDFSLLPDGGIVGVGSTSATGATVTLAFRYSGVSVTIARVAFIVSVDGGQESALELTPTSPSPVVFAGGSGVRDAADHQAGTWQATVTNAASGTWTVRCEAYSSSGNLRFPSGQSIVRGVSAPGPVSFEFTAKQGRAEPA